MAYNTCEFTGETAIALLYQDRPLGDDSCVQVDPALVVEYTVPGDEKFEFANAANSVFPSDDSANAVLITAVGTGTAVLPVPLIDFQLCPESVDI